MTNSKTRTASESNESAESLRQCLASNQALDLQAILGQVKLERETVVALLDRLVQHKEVEVLCPVTVERGGASLSLHPLEHYRLVRPSDNDYLWETSIREEHVRIHKDGDGAWQAISHLPERTLDFSWLWPKTYAYSAG